MNEVEEKDRPIEELMAHAAHGTLGEDFEDWHRADESGWTVAHQYVTFRPLPAHFDQWDLADNEGFTVAHVAAACGRLPSRYTRYDVTDKHGRTVLDAAFSGQRFRKWFSQHWLAADILKGDENE